MSIDYCFLSHEHNNNLYPLDNLRNRNLKVWISEKKEKIIEFDLLFESNFIDKVEI